MYFKGVDFSVIAASDTLSGLFVSPRGEFLVYITQPPTMLTPVHPETAPSP